MIDDPRLRERLCAAFAGLRRLRPELGVGELLAALGGAPEDWEGTEEAKAARLAKEIWCATPPDRQAFDELWLGLAVVEPEMEKPIPSPTLDPPTPTATDEPPPEPEPAATPPAPEPKPRPDEKTFQPVGLAPEALGRDPTELVAGGPVTRRGMVHALRRLGKPQARGGGQRLDVEATVRTAAAQGFYLGPVFSPVMGNAAEVAFLVDQEGSMVPFHRLTRDLVAAAVECGFQEVVCLYFHDTFSEQLFRRETLQDPVDVDRFLARCGPATSIVLVGDAGAARGGLDVPQRIVPTLRSLARLSGRTTVWLNPMPAHRWEDTSAEYIGQAVAMYPMTQDGIVAAVDALRGVRAGGA